MLKTRLIAGTIMAALAAGLLVADAYLAPWFPFLFVTVALLALLAGRELLGLIDAARRPRPLLVLGALLAIVAANWLRPLHSEFPRFVPYGDPWHAILGLIALTFVLAFLYEMATFTGPGEAIVRVALTAFAVCYLGLLPAFLAQQRWLPSGNGTLALALTIAVPKCCDIGAFTAGNLFGKHRMTPLLSPKKTWEGAVGGLLFAVAAAVGIAALEARPEWWIAKAATFGLIVGVAGMLGDLAESLLKREGQKKDASTAVPGFGGVLDVVDSLLFAAPASYLLLTIATLSPLG